MRQAGADEDGADAGEDQPGDHEPGAAEERAGPFAEPADGVRARSTAELAELVDDPDARGRGRRAEKPARHRPDGSVRGHYSTSRNREVRKRQRNASGFEREGSQRGGGDPPRNGGVPAAFAGTVRVPTAQQHRGNRDDGRDRR